MIGTQFLTKNVKIRQRRSPFGPILGSLRAPAFRWWFLSQVLSASGSMTQGVAQAWLVLRLTGSGLDLGLLSSLFMLPVLLGGPIAGAITDRVDRRRLLIVTQSLFILLAASLAILTATGAVRVWMLFVLAFATGAVSAPDGAARQVYVMDLVGRERLASAVSMNEVVLNLSRVIGPALGGLFLATLGIAACFAANAASYLPPLLVLLMINRLMSAGPARPVEVPAAGPARRLEAPAAAATRPGVREGPWRGVAAGLAYAWRKPEIRSLLLMAAASGMLFNLGVALPLLATSTLHLGGAGYGLLMAAFGVGGVGGAVLAASGQSIPSGRSVRLLAVLTGLSILATAAAPGAGLAFPGMVLTGCLSIWFIARANTLAQLVADPAMRGRVMGIWVMALPGMQPVTSPVVGFTAEAAGARAGFGLAGAALLLTAAAGWRSLADHGGAPGRDRSVSAPRSTVTPEGSAATP